MKIRGTQNQWPNIASPGKLCKYCVFYCLANGKSRDTGADYTNECPPPPSPDLVELAPWLGGAWRAGHRAVPGWPTVEGHSAFSSPPSESPASTVQPFGQRQRHPPRPFPPPCSSLHTNCTDTHSHKRHTHHMVTCSPDSPSITVLRHLFEFAYLIRNCLFSSGGSDQGGEDDSRGCSYLWGRG